MYYREDQKEAGRPFQVSNQGDLLILELKKIICVYLWGGGWVHTCEYNVQKAQKRLSELLEL